MPPNPEDLAEQLVRQAKVAHPDDAVILHEAVDRLLDPPQELDEPPRR